MDSRSTTDLAQSLFQPLPPLPHFPNIGYQPLVSPDKPASLFHPPAYQPLRPPPQPSYHDLIAPPQFTYSSTTPSPIPKPRQVPTPQNPQPSSSSNVSASSHQPPNLFPLESHNPLASYLHTYTHTFDDQEFPEYFMMEKDQETTTEPQVTEPMEEEASSIPMPPPPPPPNIDQNKFFTLEDIPPSQWRARLLEILAWAQVQLQKPAATQADVISQIPPRLLGRLKEWWTDLGQYRQLQAMQSPNVETFVTHLHNEFIGAPFYLIDKQREEYLHMKCCSFHPKELEKHYEAMSARFYAINGIDDTNLKQAYLNSMPEPLGNETAKMLSTKNLTVSSATFGELYQNSLLALEKFCNTSKYLRQVDVLSKKLGTACASPFPVKCTDSKNCDCPPKKKHHFKRMIYKPASPKWRFLRKKKSSGKTTDTCFICKKRGHFAKNCPQEISQHPSHATGPAAHRYRIFRP